MQAKVVLRDKLAQIDAFWSPRIAARYNDNDVMLVKVEGAFVWHSHPDTDDLFLLLDGKVDIELRDRVVQLNPGELFVVPRGVEHRPVAHGVAHLLVIEPSGTPNTGDPKTAARKTAI